MKKIFCFALIICALMLLCSCSEDEVPVYDPTAVAPETREELYSYYDQIKRNMTREQIEGLFGEGEIKYDEDGIEMYRSYRNEKKSAGVNIIYKPNDTVYGKILYYNKSADLVPFSNEYTEDRIPEIEEGQIIAKAEEIFGASLEIACTYSDETVGQTSRIRSWFNSDGTNFQVHTTDDIITSRVLNKPER